MRPNYLVKVIDETTYTPSQVANVTEIPKQNILIMGQYPKGRTNSIQLFTTGIDFINNVSDKNTLKYGIGPELALVAIGQGWGVYVANLRPADASYANVHLIAKHKITENVQDTDEQGAPLYLTPEGEVTTDSSEPNTAKTHNELHIKYSTLTTTAATSKDAVRVALEANFSDVADVDGYKTMPLFSFVYKGASVFGNNSHLRLIPKVDKIGNMMYAVNVFNGTELLALPSIVGVSPEATIDNDTAFIENIINGYDTGIECLTSEHLEDFLALVETYVPNLETYDIFDLDEYAAKIDTGSLDVSVYGAIQLASGSDGASDQLDTLIGNFLNGDIVPDILSLIRYRITLIPDLNFTDTVKGSIATFLNKRTYTGIAQAMCGDVSTMASAITDRKSGAMSGNFKDFRFIPKCQGSRVYDSSAKRTIFKPASYFDFMALMSFENKYGLSEPFMGASARVDGYDENTMVYPKEDDTVLDELNTYRVNVIKKDREPGGYMYTQNMGTTTTSDLTEFNNRILTSNILYDCLEIAHSRNGKFLETKDLDEYNESIKMDVLPLYTNKVSGIIADVSKKGLTGEDKNISVIKITINFKDIDKATEIYLKITDEDITQ